MLSHRRLKMAKMPLYPVLGFLVPCGAWGNAMGGWVSRVDWWWKELGAVLGTGKAQLLFV